ncbi:MAG: Rpn family recombination-promoting nuclease/putative transposase [Chitinispirillales bacterium]|nr:Rpn family recombination-promoting nuclease/putative transposase [Chitinispirillales bacterium]
MSYYSAQMLVEQIGNGDKYLNIKPVISIIIVERPLIIESKKRHNVFSMLEKEESFPLGHIYKFQQRHILFSERNYRKI